jgi:hypothetical protein
MSMTMNIIKRNKMIIFLERETRYTIEELEKLTYIKLEKFYNEEKGLK